MKHFLSLILLLIAFNVQSQYAKRNHYGAKFEPENNIINCAGQSDENAFSNYFESMGIARHLMLYMEYLRVQNKNDDNKTSIRSVGTYGQTLELSLNEIHEGAYILKLSQSESGIHGRKIIINR